ncbi:GH32 C-terminal domain-containing protein [Corynebacterium durum]
MPPGSELVLVDTAGDAVARLSVNGNVVELDRQDQQYHAGGDVRRACLRGVTSAVDVRVLVDASCLEIFIDEGRISFASRIFPRHEPNECIVRVLT